jgi:hypothetical protein
MEKARTWNYIYRTGRMQSDKTKGRFLRFHDLAFTPLIKQKNRPRVFLVFFKTLA